jgi:DNA-binding transcriptional ArsR family regulator
VSTDRLSLAFGALADPTRRAILAQLAHSGEATVATLAAPHRMSSPAISKHLKVLERAGLVEVGRNATARPRRLVAAPLQEATAWLEAYRPFWESAFDRLDDYVRGLKAERAARAGAVAAPNAPPGPRAEVEAGAPCGAAGSAKSDQARKPARRPSPVARKERP